MAVQTLKVGGREFVILPKREYERLAAKEAKRSASSGQDNDVPEAKRRLQAIARGRSKTIPVKRLRTELGL
jgi:hypothetical protein